MTRSGYLGIVKRRTETGTAAGSSYPTLQEQRRFEEALLKIPQVRRAQVEAADDKGLSEIHVVTTSARSPKQTVRDVQSLAAAVFGVRIDHRIVSVVQLEEDVEDTRAPQRVSIERVGMGTRSGAEWVEVELLWPTGETTQGSGPSGRSRESRARGAATATLECLDKALSIKKATVELENIVIHKMGPADWVLVHCSYYEQGGSTPLMGSALILDDLATAAARALLNALNRKIHLG